MLAISCHGAGLSSTVYELVTAGSITYDFGCCELNALATHFGSGHFEGDSDVSGVPIRARQLILYAPVDISIYSIAIALRQLCP